MELTSLVSGMTEFAANLYPLKTEEELVALLSGMHHFPPGVPERARRVHERLPAGSALCSSDVGVLIDRLDTVQWWMPGARIYDLCSPSPISTFDPGNCQHDPQSVISIFHLQPSPTVW